jgi:Tfp pilus assembly protein FimT
MIELVVVVGIAGILGSIAWLRLAYVAPKYRLQGATRDLAAEIQKARSQAIADNQCVRVSFDTNATTYTLSTAPGAASCATATFSTGTAMKLEDTGTISMDDGSGGTPASAIFNPRGGSEATGGAYPTIRLSNDLGDACLVLVNSTGRVSVQ